MVSPSSSERTIVALLKRLRDDGKTILCVHHDLSTVAEYFDEVVLLQREIVAVGPVDDVFTRATVERTYGGRVAVALPADGTLRDDDDSA